MSEPLRYEGKSEYQPQSGEKDSKGQILYPYIASEDLIEAVNLAIDLGCPLLLEGEPGCGKTRLARAVAYEFAQKYLKPQGIEKEWPYFPWPVRSDTIARDGLYTYDAIGRLRDAQMIGINTAELKQYLNSEEKPQEFDRLINRLKDIKKYRHWGALGEALQPENQHRPIVLIDEIDKADVDFPNDLLQVLDDLSFDVPETGEEIQRPSHTPIVFVTSNREKPLPDAFLRRCIYFYVDFPNDERLFDIAEKRFPKWSTEYDDVVDEAINRTLEIRELIEAKPSGKPPGTSEFLNFLGTLLNKPVGEAMQDLKQLAQRTPLLGILLKSKADQDFFAENDILEDDE